MSGSVDSNPILDALQESLSAPKKEVQETACEALSKVCVAVLGLYWSSNGGHALQ